MTPSEFRSIVNAGLIVNPVGNDYTPPSPYEAGMAPLVDDETLTEIAMEMAKDEEVE